MNDGNVTIIPRVRIGRAAKLYGLTMRAIRFYEEQGLLQSRRDGRNTRYFDVGACRKLEWIALLRTAGVSIGDISDVLAAEDRDGSGAICAVERLIARRRAAEIDLTLVDLALLKLRPAAKASRTG